MTNAEVVAAERDMLFALLCRLSKNMHVQVEPAQTTGASTQEAIVTIQLNSRDYLTLKDLRYRQELTEAGLNAMPWVTPL